MKSTVAVTIGVAAILTAPAAQAYPPRIAPGDDAALCASLDDGGTVSPVSYVATYFKIKTGSNAPEVYLPEMLDAVSATCPGLTDSLLQANAHLESASFDEQRILDDQARARNGCYSLPCNPTPVPAGS
ncbi:hypothetical protein [Mycolicibacterium sp. S3B2]|uniref:hypothetical protein n=1 Tax=Mycolicibacterium sp. S3B2 TaxID=3415120 RepID=UPI003C7B3A7B